MGAVLSGEGEPQSSLITVTCAWGRVPVVVDTTQTRLLDVSCQCILCVKRHTTTATLCVVESLFVDQRPCVLTVVFRVVFVCDHTMFSYRCQGADNPLNAVIVVNTTSPQSQMCCLPFAIHRDT